MMKPMEKPDFLDEIENKLKDRATDYLIVCMHDDKMFYRYSSKIATYGMASYIKAEIKNEWLDDIEDDAD